MMTHLSPDVLNDYADGSIVPAARVAAAEHLASCVSCRAELQGLESLLSSLRALPRNIEPSRDLLAGIHERSALPERRDWQSRSLWSARYWLAAAAVVLIAASSLVTRQLANNTGGDSADTSTALSAQRNASQTELQYMLATDALLNALRRERAGMSPELLRLVDENLRVIDQSILESRAALREQPGNAALHSLIRASYERKIDLLRSAVSQVTS
jgi:predicted anti-sigma-YlaC factor YlaD